MNVKKLIHVFGQMIYVYNKYAQIFILIQFVLKLLDVDGMQMQELVKTLLHVIQLLEQIFQFKLVSVIQFNVKVTMEYHVHKLLIIHVVNSQAQTFVVVVQDLMVFAIGIHLE